jgi:hypothetical protein
MLEFSKYVMERWQIYAIIENYLSKNERTLNERFKNSCTVLISLNLYSMDFTYSKNNENLLIKEITSHRV